MDKKKNRKFSNNWKNQNRNNDRQQNDFSQKEKKFQFNKAAYEDSKAETERQKQIQDLKAKEVICPKCGQPILDMPSSLADKVTGLPIHFDCAINQVRESEKTGENEKIAYIGQGRFAVLYYENIRDQKHFTIKKIIEWENNDTKADWRDNYSELYSKIN